MSTIDALIGERLRQLRLGLGERQEDFAVRLGVASHATIGKYERGERQLAVADIATLATSLNQPPIVLLLRLLPHSDPALQTLVETIIARPALLPELLKITHAYLTDTSASE